MAMRATGANKSVAAGIPKMGGGEKLRTVHPATPDGDAATYANKERNIKQEVARRSQQTTVVGAAQTSAASKKTAQVAVVGSPPPPPPSSKAATTTTTTTTTWTSAGARRRVDAAATNSPDSRKKTVPSTSAAAAPRTKVTTRSVGCSTTTSASPVSGAVARKSLAPSTAVRAVTNKPRTKIGGPASATSHEPTAGRPSVRITNNADGKPATSQKPAREVGDGDSRLVDLRSSAPSSRQSPKIGGDPGPSHSTDQDGKPVRPIEVAPLPVDVAGVHRRSQARGDDSASISVAASARCCPRSEPITEAHYSQHLLKFGYKLGPTVGTGSYSKVKLAEQLNVKTRRFDKKVACKLIDTRKASKTYVDKFLPRELKILRSINHQNLVNLERIIDLGPIVCLFMEYGSHGDLLDRIQKTGALSDPESKRCFRQISNGLQYLHKRGISHRDLKCENVMLFPNGVIKLTDFGFARGYLDPKSGEPVLSRTFCGSMAYAAPEIIQALPYFPNMYDMWSLGCVLFIMVTGKMPFNDKNASQLLKQQMSRSLNYPFGCLASSHCKQLIRELLNPKPDQRPDTDKVLTSKWLAKPAVGRTSVSGLSGAARRQHVLLNQ